MNYKSVAYILKLVYAIIYSVLYRVYGCATNLMRPSPPSHCSSRTMTSFVSSRLIVVVSQLPHLRMKGAHIAAHQKPLP